MLFNVTENCGNMDSNLLNKVSQIIEIEDDVIDLDGAEKTPEEVIYEWDAKIRKKLSTFAVADNEYVLGDLMKEYLQSLQEMTRSYEDNETLKNKVFCHISFLYSYYVELQCCTPDNYLSNMEDILTLHCNLELEVIRPLKKKDLSKHKYKKRIVSVSRQIIHVLTVYLLERHDHILHVLIKMNTNKVSDSCSEVLNILYTHFLTKVPAFNLCDESFCRNYIVFQKWKEIRKVEDWEGMDKIMYRMFKRTPESIKNNETLRQILMPACQSTVDIVLNLFRSFRAISSAYFKHVVAKRSIDMDDLIFNIDLGEDEPTIAIDDDNDEGVQFLKAYYEVERNMSNLSHTNTSDNTEIDIFRKCKEEFDEDDDVQFIGITMLPKQPILDFVIDNEEPVHRMSNVNTKRHIEEERIPVPSPPLITSAKEKNADLENLNGITRICIGSPRTVPEPSNSCQPTEIETDPDPPAPASRICIGSPRTVPEPSNSRKPTEIHTDPDPPAPASRICIGSPRTVPEPATELQSAPASSPAKEVVNPCDVPAETQPEVSFVSNNTQIPSPSSPTKISDCDNTHKRTIEMKSVEVQADSIKNYLYNDYGLTTPPSDVPTDEQNSRPVEPRLYTNIGQTHKDLTPEKEKTVATRTVEVQVDCEYDYGLTPPNDPHLEDHGARAQEPCLYTNIGHKDLSDGKNEENFGDSQRIGAQTESETEIAVAEHDSDYDEFDIPNVDGDYDTEEIDVESCHENDKDSPLGLNHEEAAFDIRINPDLQISKEPYDAFKTSDQIDTGQKVILNTAPNIEPVTADSQTKVILNEPVTADSETKETYNGGSVLKPLVSSNRTNGHAKDVVNTPTKIMYTSSQKIKAATLDDFSRFESAMHVQWNKMKENHDFEEILSGPVSKIMPTKLLSAQDKLDIFGQESKSVTNSSSRSNSPNEMTSPAYEAIDDFRNYFSDSVNGRVPPPHDARVPPPLDARVPPGILKKNNTARRKNFRIMFHESTCDNSEERKPRSDGVLVPKRVRRDRKLNMEPRVVVERLSFIENKMKKVLNNPPTLRVDYDKTTTHINEKDVVRCISPPRFSWIINLTPSRHNPGSMTVKNREHLEKKPKKRKFEPQNNSIGEPVMRKRAFRTPKKKSLAGSGGRGVRKRQNSGSSENTFVSKSDSEFDKLLNSGAYSNKPFRLDLTS